MEFEKDNRTIVILGPTGSGKSDLAMELARRWNGEIISCDSMQVYHGLEIGTAMPTPEMRQEIPHHLVDCFHMSERYDANRFKQLAEDAIRRIHDRGRRAIVVGGTGLYARALVYGLSLLPSDHELSARLHLLAETEEGRELLLQELVNAGADPKGIPEHIRQNPRHLQRAVEVLRLTGKFSWEIAAANSTPNPDFLQFCLIPDLEALKERIRRRTAKMLEAGWIEEALKAGSQGLLETPTARQALGYREIIQACANGIPADLTELKNTLVSKNIAYARRQLTWFRHQHPGSKRISSPEDLLG